MLYSVLLITEEETNFYSMTKAIPYILFSVVAAYYVYRTIKKALEDPPDETKYYSSTDAAIADGASADDEWLWSDLDGPQCF